MIRIVLDIDESILPELDKFKESLNGRIVGTPLRGGGVISITIDTDDSKILIEQLLVEKRIKHFNYTVL